MNTVAKVRNLVKPAAEIYKLSDSVYYNIMLIEQLKPTITMV